MKTTMTKLIMREIIGGVFTMKKWSCGLPTQNTVFMRVSAEQERKQNEVSCRLLKPASYAGAF